MSDEPVTRRALRTAEGETPADTSRLVAATPRLMREAQRRRREAGQSVRSLPQLASWALPRLAAVTTLAVLAAGWVVVRDNRRSTPNAPTTLESVILGGDSADTGDVLFDALLGVERGDG